MAPFSESRETRLFRHVHALQGMLYAGALIDVISVNGVLGQLEHISLNGVLFDMLIVPRGSNTSQRYEGSYAYTAFTVRFCNDEGDTEYLFR